MAVKNATQDPICSPSSVLTDSDHKDPLWLGIIFPCGIHSILIKANTKNGGEGRLL